MSLRFRPGRWPCLYRVSAAATLASAETRYARRVGGAEPATVPIAEQLESRRRGRRPKKDPNAIRRGRRPMAFGLVFAGLILITGCAGFVWFAVSAQRDPTLPAHAEGIVALTGGADRVSAALHLLAEGRANDMLVTGIGGGAVLPEFTRPAKVSLREIAARVTLGRGAVSTHGNAIETAAWASRNDIHSIILVTAFYHMPRAMLEMRRALPGLTFYPAPVFPAETMALGTRLRLLSEEYFKYLGTLVGLPSLAPSLHPALTVAQTADRHT